MNRLDDLIKEYCPDGVVFRRISEVATVERGKRVVREQLPETGKYRVYQNSLTPLGFFNDSNYKHGTAFVIGAGAAGEIGFSDDDFWAADDCYPLVCGELVNGRYLYHVLLSKQIYISSQVRKGSIPRLSRSVIENIRIPVPPIEVQREIVRILDNFTELTAELTAELTTELTARKKQYEYYLDTLLCSNNSSLQKRKLEDISSVYDGTHQTPEYQDDGVPFISVENIANIYSTTKYITANAFSVYKIKPQVGDVFMTRIGSIGKCAIMTKQTDVAYYVSLALIRPNQEIIDSRYLKYYIESIYGRKELAKRTLHHAVPIKINKDDIGKIAIVFPKLYEQRRIADLLDSFESMCSDLKDGLPAEIEARQKQYEFYRDKLLSFKELGA